MHKNIFCMFIFPFTWLTYFTKKITFSSYLSYVRIRNGRLVNRRELCDDGEEYDGDDEGIPKNKNEIETTSIKQRNVKLKNTFPNVG